MTLVELLVVMAIIAIVSEVLLRRLRTDLVERLLAAGEREGHHLPPELDGHSSQRPRAAADIRDGLSNTWLFFEDAGRPQGWADGRPTRSTNVSGVRWADVESSFHVHEQRAGKMQNVSNNNEIYALHFGGATYGMGDEAVRFGSDMLDPEVFVSLCPGQAGDTARGDW